MKHNNRIFWFIACLLTSTCGCDLGDVCGLDDDGDGITNCDDVCPIHFDANIIDRKQYKEKGCANCQDSDEDGIIDCLDLCPEDKDREWGDCGCVDSIPGTEGIYLTCPDIEGLEDLCPNDPMKTDPGVCGCGVSDRLIVWDDDNLTQGNPRSECPVSGAVDLCPFDDDKTDPGQCGCGVPDTDSDNDSVADCLDECPQDANKVKPGECGCGSPDTDTDHDDIIDCKDLCPEDPLKRAPGVCGCGVEDSATNLIDTDKDGTVDCVDECPENPYKILPGPTGCNNRDTDGDGIEDKDDACPYNPDIKSLDAEGNQPDCNYVTNSEGKEVFRVWDATDLERLKGEITKRFPESKEGMLCDEKSDEAYCIDRSNVQIQSLGCGDYFEEATCTPNTNLVSCKKGLLGLNTSNLTHCPFCLTIFWPRLGSISSCNSNGTPVCGEAQGLCIDESTYYDCNSKVMQSCLCKDNHCVTCDNPIQDTGGNAGDCCDASTYKSSCSEDGHILTCNDLNHVESLPCLAPCKTIEDEPVCIIDKSPESKFIVEIMKDLDLSSSHKCNKKLGGIGNYQSLDLYNTTLIGNNHTIRFSQKDERCAISEPLFNNVIQSTVSDLMMDIDVKGNVNSAFSNFVNNSIINNVEYRGDVTIDHSINGEELINSNRCELKISYSMLTGEWSGNFNFYYLQECKEIVFGSIAGYAYHSIFNNPTFSGTVSTRLDNINVSAMIGISENAEIHHARIESDFLYAPNTNVSPIIFRSFDKLSITDSLINVREIEATSYYGIEEFGEDTSISNSRINLGTVNSTFYYPFVGSGNFYSKYDLTEDPYKSEIAQQYWKSNDNQYNSDLDVYFHIEDNYDCHLYPSNEDSYPLVCLNKPEWCTLSFSKLSLDHVSYYQQTVSSGFYPSGNADMSISNLSFFGSYEFIWSFEHPYVIYEFNGLLNNNAKAINNASIVLKYYPYDDNQPFLPPIVGTNYTTENMNHIFWLKDNTEDYAFADCASLEFGYGGFSSLSPDPADDGTVFIPFTATQTDEVVSQLGEGWTKKKVTYHDVEQDKDVEIEIPWLKAE